MFYSKRAFAVGISLLMLAGCSHANPLNQYSHETVARDLLASAVTAEMKLGLAKQAYQAGGYYFECMEGERSTSTCNTLYRAMQSSLKNRYAGITVADIHDKKLWSFVKDYYQGDLFDRLPG